MWTYIIFLLLLQICCKLRFVLHIFFSEKFPLVIQMNINFVFMLTAVRTFCLLFNLTILHLSTELVLSWT